MKELYKKLKKKYGNHTKAAHELGITQRHYRAIRSGKVPLTPTMRRLVVLLASKK